jgi:hypothetical protein
MSLLDARNRFEEMLNDQLTSMTVAQLSMLRECLQNIIATLSDELERRGAE